MRTYALILPIVPHRLVRVRRYEKNVLKAQRRAVSPLASNSDSRSISIETRIANNHLARLTHVFAVGDR